MPRLILSLLIFASLSFQTPVPVLEEPRHQVVFQNKFVRVIDAAVPVGDATLFHTHSIDNVPVAINGGSLKTETIGKDTAFSKVETGAVSFAAATYSHRISNVGATPLRFIDAEILASSGKSSALPSLTGAPGSAMVLDHPRVRIYRLILDQDQSTGLHTHRLPWLSVVVRGRRMASEQAGKKSEVEEIEPGKFKWHEQEITHAISNLGPGPLEMIIIEWK